MPAPPASCRSPAYPAAGSSRPIRGSHCVRLGPPPARSGNCSAILGSNWNAWAGLPAWTGPARRPSSALRAALALRQQHPSWGAGYIRVRLAGAADAAVLPSERTCSVGSVSNTSRRLLPDGAPSTPTSRATAPHDTWQMDAVEQLRLGSGQGVCWLRLVDEYSGAFLGTTVFPHYQWGHVLPTAVQQQLRTAFTRWGLPCQLRVDNGKPWGSWSDLPPALARCG